MDHKFACVINCMDGRIQTAVIDYMKDRFQLAFIDNITLAGPSKVIADEAFHSITENIKFRLDISVQKHGAEIIAVVGHFDCAGIPTEDDVQKEFVIQSVKKIQSWYPNCMVIPLWVESSLEVLEIK